MGALRSTLILAGVLGAVIVVFGLLLMVMNPEEYGLASGRESLALEAQPQPEANKQEPRQVLWSGTPTDPPPLPQVVPAPPMQPATPVRLIIKRLGINAPIVTVGTDKNGAIETPPIDNPNLIGWYRHGPTAGEAGPAVMLGHKDTRTRPAVFSRVGEIRNGDVIEVKRRDGTTAVFTVGGVEQIGKQVFPTERVYGDQQNAQLHLITCGGVYNRNTGHYTDNIIVYATMTKSYRS
ncbi:class F sortase [Thermoactinospora rubra]|uniref:class F sortase n=1 Tax=Thermoactinospora rubra TaxID=1088767 RepID=UPI001F0A3EF4|nr:class F sortase [Thermoactinospora rubra]